MVTAISLINVTRGAIQQCAQDLLQIDGITEVYSVAGQWDLVAVLRVKDNERLEEIVTSQMLQLATITKSETLIAFRAISKHDLERMFSVGL